MRYIVLILVLFVAQQGEAQTNNCKVVLVSRQINTDTTGINERYRSKGIYLLRNGIYNFNINGKKFPYHRILKIWNDSIKIAWTTDSFPTYSFSVQEIKKVIFPSLNNGVTGFPHPTMTQKKYKFEMVSRNPCELELTRVCQTENCDKYISGYFYMCGYGWKTIYNKNGAVEMIDETVIHKITRNNKLVRNYPPASR